MRRTRRGLLAAYQSVRGAAHLPNSKICWCFSMMLAAPGNWLLRYTSRRRALQPAAVRLWI